MPRWPKRETITGEQFSALAELLGLHDGPAREGARAVMCDGMSVNAAAAQAGCLRQSVSNTLRRCRRGLELARAVCEAP